MDFEHQSHYTTAYLGLCFSGILNLKNMKKNQNISRKISEWIVEYIIIQRTFYYIQTNLNKGN